KSLFIMQSSNRLPIWSSSLLVGASLILIISGVRPGSIRPCWSESEASSSASSEAGSESGLLGRRRRWRLRHHQINPQAQCNKAEIHHEAQVRRQEEKADNRRIRRPDRDFVRNYRASGRQRFKGSQPQIQPVKPAGQSPAAIK